MKTIRFVLLILLSSGIPLFSQDSLSIKGDADSLLIFWATDSLKLPRSKKFQLPLYVPETASKSEILSGSNLQSPETDNLSAHGYIARGIQLGSSRGLSLQSGMNLRLEGNLGSGMRVTGVLSDQNSPLQPLGNTQTLSELDKVYIKLESENLSGQIGDVELGSPQTGGLTAFQRRTNGIWLKGKRNQWRSYAGAGFSYGTFSRQSLQGQDGKQGPYVLKGQYGENFILILAGTEQVRVDGELLKRGEDQDYTIDYNSAEINFTNLRMITSQNQIVVDFEYAADAFLSEYSFGKQLATVEAGYGDSLQTWSWNISGNLIQDDAKNPLGEIGADSLRKVLGQIPDLSGRIWLSTIKFDFSGDYSLSPDSILTYVGTGLGDHTAAFTFVGVGRGNYRKIQDFSGFTYYEYSTTTGAYLPAKAYVAPQQQTMMSYRLNYRGKHLKSWFDGAYSAFNPNMYAENPSTLKKPGLRAGASYIIPVGEQALEFDYTVENLTQGFYTYQPTHSEDYYRTWQTRPRVTDHDKYQRVALALKDGFITRATIAVDQFERNDRRVGLRAATHGVLGKLDRSSLNWEDQWLQFSAYRSWQRHRWEGNWRLHQWLLGGLVESESGSQDTTIFMKNNHVTNRISLGYNWSDDASMTIAAQRRTELISDSIAKPEFLSLSASNWTEYRNDYSMKINYSGKPWLSGNLLVIYRQRFSSPSDPTVSQGYVLSNVDVQGVMFKDKVSYQSSSELNEERIPQFEYYYIPVDTGYGNYSYDPVYGYIPNPGGTWLQQRSYTDHEQRVRSVTSHNILRFNSKMPKGGSKLFSNAPIKLWTNFNIERKARIDTNWVLQNRVAVQSEIQVNPALIWKSVNYSYRISRNDNNLNFYGSEVSQTHGHVLGLKWSTRKQPINTEFSTNTQLRKLSYNTIQNEDWQRFGILIEYPWEVIRDQTITTRVRYQNANQATLTKHDEVLKLALSHEWRLLRRGRLDQTVEYGSVKSGQTNLPYALFDGQQPGENWEYRLNANYRFSNAFQLQGNYSIRKRGTRGTEQFFRMEGRAYF